MNSTGKARKTVVMAHGEGSRLAQWGVDSRIDLAKPHIDSIRLVRNPAVTVSSGEIAVVLIAY